MAQAYPVPGYRNAAARQAGEGGFQNPANDNRFAANDNSPQQPRRNNAFPTRSAVGTAAAIARLGARRVPYVQIFIQAYELWRELEREKKMVYGWGIHPTTPAPMCAGFTTPPFISTGPLPGGPAPGTGCGTTETEGPVPIGQMPAYGVDPLTGRGAYVWNRSFAELYPQTGIPPNQQWISGFVYYSIQVGAALRGNTWYARPLWTPAIPAVHPAIDPFSLPIMKPVPMPEPLPYRALPYVRSNPWRVYNNEAGNVVGHAEPDPFKDPYSEAFASPPQAAPLPKHKNAPPDNRTKERKSNVWGLGATTVGKVFGAATETGDAVDSLWDALPDSFKKKEMAKRHGKKPKLLDKIGQLFDNWEDVNVEQAIGNLIANQIEDRAYGAVGKALQKPGKAMGSNRGLSGGPWSKVGKTTGEGAPFPVSRGDLGLDFGTTTTLGDIF